ncbi:hypothetical protein JCM3765_003359 [Sporobolomyces pararoseus]
MSNAHRAVNRAQQSFLSSTRPSLASIRPLSTCTSTRSSSSPSPLPSLPDRTASKNRTIYRRIVRTAVIGAYELSSPSSAPPYSLRSQGFKPPKVRRTANSQDGARAKLIEFEPGRVLNKAYSRNSRRKASAGGLRGKRQFSTSFARARASEDTLELDEGLLDVEAGDWDAATGGNRMKMPKPGDWVETRRGGTPASGIYLSKGATSARRFQVLPISGTRSEVSLDDITYVLPGVISADLASSASWFNAPDFSPSSPAALEMLQKLREIEFSVEEESKVIVSRGVHDLYQLLHTASSPVPSKKRPNSPPTSLTISSALKALRISATSSSSTSHSIHLARQIAMHRILLDNPQYFLADGLALRVSGKFDLRDPLEAARFDTVRDWMRRQSKEMKSFTEKAARIREWGRNHPVEKICVDGKLEKRELPEEKGFRWTKEDQEVIRFLRDSLAYDRAIQSQPHMAIAPSILKLVDRQSAELGYQGWGTESSIKKERIREFLMEIGEVAQWENWVAHSKATGLQNWESMGGKVERALSRGKARAKTDGPLSSTEFYPQDPHDSIRHDFGNLPVFTIDDAGAFELDDGISLSPAPPSSTGKTAHWVHVHIADPTALLHPGHLVSKLARVRDHTEYFPEKTWSMLPDTFVENEMLSLGSVGGGEQKVMSFGMRIEEETGEILESNVQVGVVRKVHRLTYAGVDAALGHQPPPPNQKIQHPVFSSSQGGGTETNLVKSRQRHIDDEVLTTNPETVSALRVLHRISKKLLAKRAADSALFWNFPSASVSVSPSITPSFETVARPTFYSSSPLVNLQLPSASDRSFVDSPASLLVSELMVAANRTAARFCVEKGLHVPFRTQGAPSATPEALETVMKLRDPETGQAPAVDVLKHSLDFLPGANTPTTGPHWPMGINDSYGYLKVTSPLRRYSDLFTHWQLKSALLPASSLPSFATPQFDLASVLSHIQGFDAAAKARHRLSEASSTFWSLFVISRKLSLLKQLSSPTSTLSATGVSQEDTEFINLLSGGLTAIPLRIAAHSAFDNLHVQPVLIPQLGIRGTLEFEKLEMAPQVGEEVEVKIDEVVLSSRSKIVVSRR